MSQLFDRISWMDRISTKRPDRSPEQIDGFMRRIVRFECGCWQVGKGSLGDSQKQIEGMQAHRWSYMLLNGDIPERYVIDHLCANPACVNPDHLEAVTHSENMRRKHMVTAACDGDRWPSREKRMAAARRLFLNGQA